MQGKYKAAQSKEITKEIYTYIVRYFKTHGYAPTMKEIAADTLVSTTTAERHVAVLIEGGFLATDHPGMQRAFRVTNYEFRRKRVPKDEQ